MRLRELIPTDEPFGFIRREIEDGREIFVVVESIGDADGIEFLCPMCFVANGGRVGTHAVICWRPRVPENVFPKPGRWEFLGSGLDDLTLVAGSSSVCIQEYEGGPEHAHFYIRNGQIEWAGAA